MNLITKAKKNKSILVPANLFMASSLRRTLVRLDWLWSFYRSEDGSGLMMNRKALTLQTLSFCYFVSSRHAFITFGNAAYKVVFAKVFYCTFGNTNVKQNS